MARNRKKMSLYEAIGKSLPKPCYGKTLEQSHPDKLDKTEPTTAKSPERAVQWPRKPKLIQFNAGRIEISVPYPLAVALLLGIILLALAFFRLGQTTYQSEQGITGSAGKTPKGVQKAAGGLTTDKIQTADADQKISPGAKKLGPPEQEGNNRIVIQEYQTRAHLEPVKQHFARFGIETEIRRINKRYYLVTKEKYDNPGRPGTDGYRAKQRIIAVGAEYKAPQGRETFAPNFFRDAYGMRFDD